MSKRRINSPEFKAMVAMEAISGRKTIQEIAADHAIHPYLGEPVEEAAAGWCQRAVHLRQEEQRQRRGPGQGG
jgi:hypothetical protein